MRRYGPVGFAVRVACAATLYLPIVGAETALAENPLIPRALFFQSKDLRDPRISPDGRLLAYLAPDPEGVDNLWVRTVGADDDQLITHEKGHGIPQFYWVEDSSHLLFEKDTNGDENYHVYGVDLKGDNLRDLTPYPGVRAQNLLTSPARPGEILVGLNLRDSRIFDMYRIDWNTGRSNLDTKNPGDVLSWMTDSTFAIRAATAFDPGTGDTLVRIRDRSDLPWRQLVRWSFEDSLMFGQISGGSVLAGFGPEDRTLFVLSTEGSNTGQLIELDAKSGRRLDTIASDPRSDVAVDPNGNNSGHYSPLVMISPLTHRAQAVAFEYMTWRWQILDTSVRKDFQWLRAKSSGFPIVVSRDREDQRWVVEFIRDDAPPSFYFVDRRETIASRLTLAGASVPSDKLASVRPVEVPARDGLRLVSYLTLPRHSAARNLPMVLFVHGGPWDRDDWGFDPLVQLLANRGYAVLQVNYRGSTGFGKAFLNAGNHQFGLGMQDDIEDGVHWAISQGIADPKRIGIMGYSGGGYATLRGLTRTPRLYACGIDIVGPTDLGTLFSTFAPWMQAMKSRWIRRLGDVGNDENLRHQLSSIFDADKISSPLLIGQGVQDPRVVIAQSDAMVAALRSHHVPVVYVVYPDEGHGFNRPENNLDFFGRTEEFLGSCLHGRAEPWRAVSGASAEVR